MAELSADPARTATAVTNEIDDNMVSVKLVVEGIRPVLFGDKTKAKNGIVDLKLGPSGFSMSAKVESGEGKFTNFKYEVKKLPSEIDIQQSSWKVKKDMISLKLRKKVPGSWVPLLSGGLDQASDSDEDS
ncbi:hypothetical protein EGW08_005846 [Elysia chlorotica]|uniref:CS domain-containing protein n=1 Tax=Elysia chlorotica TaxID=188477 RepID=A0A3S1C976_ELYCH|nr:hypothetical protein EGW08_005846 [Elysia chlorotica]